MKKKEKYEKKNKISRLFIFPEGFEHIYNIMIRLIIWLTVAGLKFFEEIYSLEPFIIIMFSKKKI